MIELRCIEQRLLLFQLLTQGNVFLAHRQRATCPTQENHFFSRMRSTLESYPVGCLGRVCNHAYLAKLASGQGDTIKSDGSCGNIGVSLDLKCSKLIENTGSMPILIPPTPVMSRLTVYGQFNKDIGELTEFLLEYVPKGGDPKI